MQSLNPKYRLDIWTVRQAVIFPHLTASCRLDTATALRVVTAACQAAKPGMLFGLYRLGPNVKRPLGRTNDTQVWAWTPAEESITDAVYRLSVALEDEPVPVARRRRHRALQAVGAALGGAA